MATFFVALLAITTQIKNKEVPFLHSSDADCDCIVNVTSTINNDAEVEGEGGDDGLFAIFYNISYIYYSMLGTLLTIIFGLIISYVTEKRAEKKLLKTSIDHSGHHHHHHHHFYHNKTPGHFSVASFLSLQAQRRMSSIIRNVSQTTLKVENKLKEVISYSNLHHLHHAADEERISILNEENDQDESATAVHTDVGRRKMFFIGHYDDREHDE